MIHDIVLSVAGGITALAVLFAIYYKLQVSGAYQEAEEAIKIAKQAMDAKEAAEQGFAHMKTHFEERQKQPVIAGFTEEQIETISKTLASRLFLYTNTGVVKQ